MQTPCYNACEHIFNSLMALPTNLAAKIKNFPMDPTALATEPQLAYLLSFSQHPIAHDSLYTSPREVGQSPLENYPFADFEDETYEQLQEETVRSYQARSRQLVRGIRCGFKEFYARVAAGLHGSALRFMARERNQTEKKMTLAKEEQEMRIDALKGNNPQRWPDSIKDFLKDLNALPWFAFLNDSELFLADFVEGAKAAILSLCRRGKTSEDSFRDTLLLEVQALLGVVLRTNNQSYILEQLRFISELEKHIELTSELQTAICNHVSKVLSTFFALVPQESSSKYHYPESLWNRESFFIMKKKHFQKYTGLAYYTIATDGNYLYIYVSAINGGMFKIGTGNGHTKAGKVYLERQLHYPIGTKVDEVSWVYVEGKLYLKTSSKDPWLLEVYSTTTLRKQGNVQLFCPSLFGMQSLINLNKGAPLLTDGHSIFYLGTRIKIEKCEQSERLAEKPKEVKQGDKSPEKEQKKNDKKKKKPKKNQGAPEQNKNQNYQKVLEVVLYEFPLQGVPVRDDPDIDERDIDQLYDSFSGYFTRQECKRAFALNDYDLAETCQWLFNQGQKQKEKNIRVLEYSNYVILLEAEITSNFQERNIKGPSEITTKEGSTLTINNLTESIWTMDAEHVTCYSENGVKVFSRNIADFKINPETRLGTTLLKTLESKFPKNPQYTIVYDSYNSLFYTFSWPQDGHYFPTAVLCSSDKKQVGKVQEEKRVGAKVGEAKRLTDLSKVALQHMCLLDKSAIRTRYRFNDWLWFYGQRVLEIAAEMTLPESDKKRLSNRRTKVLAKLNRINDYEKRYDRDRAIFAKNGKLTREIIKIYPFEAEGDVRNYKLILEAFKGLGECPEEVYLFVLCLEGWLTNAPAVGSEEVRAVLVEIGETLLRLKAGSEGRTRTHITRLMLQQFYLFYPTLQRQTRFIISLNDQELLQFIRSHTAADRRDKETILYEITKKEHIVQKYETTKTEFSEIFKSKSALTADPEDADPIGGLLLGEAVRGEKEALISKGKCEQGLRKQLLEYLQQRAASGSTGNKFVELLFLSSFKLLHSNTQDQTVFLRLLQELFLESFRLYERVLAKTRSEQLFHVLPTFLMVVQLYHGSLVPLTPHQEIISSLLRAAEHIQKPEFSEALAWAEEGEFEGISPVTEKIYETSHPLERGKNYSFPPRSFPEASVVLVDLDKRCQSDPNNDTLNIQILHQDSVVGNNIQINDGVFNSYLRLSGVVDTKKPYLILGNSLNVDFNSSGQVKDTQSLVRYGFKFGLRPVYAGKPRFLAGKRERVEKVFGEISNFQLFINALKFTVVAASSTVENYLHLQKEHTDSKIAQLLKNKIFKEGFEDNAYKFDIKTLSHQHIVNTFMGQVEPSHDQHILQKTHEKLWKVEQKTDEVVKAEGEVWDFQGIPSYIRGYLEQIRNFKGDFIDVFLEARQLAKEKGSYAHMMRRKTFQGKHKQFWLQGESILFLTILKHSGLLHLNLKFSIEYIKENLKAFEDARDGIYYAFISRIQNVNEWRDLLETYIGKEEPVAPQPEEPVEEKKPANMNISIKRKGKTVKSFKIGEEKPALKKQKEKIEEKPAQKAMSKAEFEKIARERLSNNEALVKGICAVRGIRYDETNQFQNVSRIIEEVIKASERPQQSPESVYTQPIQHLIRCCLFLLKFKSPSTKESLESNAEIVPVNIGRSLSSDNRNVDTNKLNLFREWLENWKKWKGFKKEGRIELKFPVQEIVKYINAWLELPQVEAAIRTRYYQCANRTLFYSTNAQLLKAFPAPLLLRYALGSESLALPHPFLPNGPHPYQTALSSIAQTHLADLEEAYNLFRGGLKAAEKSLLERLPLKLSQVQEVLKDKNYDFLQRVRPLLQTLFLLESENPQINLEAALYLIPFKHLSAQSEDLIYISSVLVQRVLIAHHDNSQLITLLEKEIGSNSVCFKRWKDFFFVQRALFLLKKLESNYRRRASAEEKVRLAQLLFYLLYHVQVPILAKLSLKILRRLNINLKAGLRTPLDRQYTLCAPADGLKLAAKETFRLSPSPYNNNVQLLCAKIHAVFQDTQQNELETRFEGVQKVIGREQEDRYNIILNLHQEEDLYWLIKALYYIDQLEIKSGEKAIPQFKDYADYVAQKGKKREDGKREQKQQSQPEAEKEKPRELERRERIFANLPKFAGVDPSLEEQLPLGWFFNYCNIFADPLEPSVPPPARSKGSSSPNPSLKGRPSKNANNNANNGNKKQWACPIYTRLAKKYEQLNSKPIEEPKEGDAQEVKIEFIRAKNFQIRIKGYINNIGQLVETFARSGFLLFREDLPRARMNQLCQILTAASSNRLKDIPLELKNAELKGRLLVNDSVPNFTSRLKITLIKTRHYPYFEQLLAFQSLLSARNDPAAPTLLARRELALPDSRAFMPYEEFPRLDESAEQEAVQFGKQWVQSSMARMRKKTERVFLSDYPGSTFFIAQGGIESGLRDNLLIPANDAALTLQTAAYDKLLTAPRVPTEETEETDFPQELMEKIERILSRNSITITTKADVREFLLLAFYLKKLNTCQLQFVDRAAAQQFTEKLLRFTSGLSSFRQLREYEEEVQKLLLKLIDNQHERLHLFGNYLAEEEADSEVEAFMVSMRLEKLNSSNDVKQQGAETHSGVKSKYLLRGQPPQIQQNKLLKYWQKNILPKIYEFVKTTLKQIQIEDFWEQMRRPLRVGDHTDAKRVAYIICDNKLPAGAVIPDANHNWNSLELEEIFVGENVLVKLPRRGEFGTPLLGWGAQEQRLARIVFIQVRTGSVLVRYRVEELGVFSYAWVPVNALMAVEKEVMHISTRSIFEELQKKLEGIVYIHAKQTLTRLAPSVSAQDTLKLLRETILDLFVDNPIAGPFHLPKPAWPMRATFQRMLQEGDLALLELLEKQFCTIRGLDLDMTSEKMTSLNRFDGAKALILSFKKEAKLSQCAGIRFFSDRYGYNQVAHVYTAKAERGDLEPLEFNDPNVYFSFYTNKECLPIVEQNNYKLHPVEATVFAVDDMWTVGCYVGELLCQIAASKPSANLLPVLERLSRLFVRWILKKSVSVLCAYLARLIAKLAMTINFVCERTSTEVGLQRLGVTAEQLKELLKWIGKLNEEESKAKVTLYSSLLQNLNQMAASLLFRLPSALTSSLAPPEHLRASIQLMRIFKQIQQFSRTRKLSGLVPVGSTPNYQWQRILQVSNIPQYFDRDTIRKKLREIIQLNKGKVLCPAMDIAVVGTNCFLLVDGWDVNELVQEEVIEKIEQEEEEKQQEEEMGMMTWICAACTFENPAAFNVCEICQTAAPAPAKQEEVYDVVQATDLKAAERKLKERQAKRFQEVKVQILKFFDDEYRTVCDLIAKRNKEMEDGNKGKDPRKNKKDVKEEPVELPKKPEVHLQTGSKVFENPAIEQFLELRFNALPTELKKLVKGEQSYLRKFRAFLGLGFDLWGDNIASEAATLIPYGQLVQLMDYVQSQICKGSSSVLSYSQESIRILSQVPLLDAKGGEEPINYASESDIGVRVKYKELGAQKSYNIRYSWKFVKELNLAASKCLQFVNMDLPLDKERSDPTPSYSDPLGYNVKYFRSLIMGVIKLQLSQKIMQKTSISRENDQVPRVELERLKAREQRVKEGLVTAKEKEDHLFTKAHSQFQKIPTAFLRPFKPKGADPYLSFTVTFKGENVMGEAGPYRQFFTDISRELAPTYNLGLFIPSPNNRHQSGEHKSRWVINPRANSTYHFSLFEFVGVLMGCCFRTGGHLALDLPTMFWKAITREEITDTDLEEVDSQLVSLLRMLQNCPSEEVLAQATDAANGEPLTWTYRSCDDQLHDLRPNGRNQRVEFAELGAYVEALRAKKASEDRLQVKRIVQGLSQLVPLPYLHCLTGQELKLAICGRPKVDVDLLKKHTKYSGGLNEDSRRIKFFWETIRELPEVEKLKIIRFCWGQERLPINSQEYQRNNIRFMIKPMIANQANQDQALPKADTCFFNIELPDYSTKQIMKEKILLAVNLDNVSINADENMMNNQDNPLMNEIDSYDQEEDYEED